MLVSLNMATRNNGFSFQWVILKNIRRFQQSDSLLKPLVNKVVTSADQLLQTGGSVYVLNNILVT